MANKNTVTNNFNIYHDIKNVQTLLILNILFLIKLLLLLFTLWTVLVSHSISNFYYITRLFFNPPLVERNRVRLRSKRSEGWIQSERGLVGKSLEARPSKNHLRSYSLAKIISFSQARCNATNHHILLVRWRENTRCGKIYVEKNLWFTITCINRNWKWKEKSGYH